MEKEELILEYLDLSLEYISFISVRELSKDRKEYVVNRLMKIREALEMDTIQL